MSNQKRVQKEYMTHPELNNFIFSEWKHILSFHMFFYIGITLIHDYYSFLATMDVVITACLLLFWLILRPMMLRGLLPAFYRKSYDQMRFMHYFGSYVFHGAILRASVFALYYIITFQLVKGDPIQTHHYVISLRDNMMNKEGAILGLLISLFFLFRYFYSERILTITEYSSRVMKLMRSTGWDLEFATDQVMQTKQLELEKKAEQVVEYEEDKVSNQSSVNNNRQTIESDEAWVRGEVEEANSSGMTTAYAQQEKSPSSTVPIRRQARRE